MDQELADIIDGDVLVEAAVGAVEGLVELRGKRQQRPPVTAPADEREHGSELERRPLVPRRLDVRARPRHGGVSVRVVGLVSVSPRLSCSGAGAGVV